jgi:hypothetical protein
VDALWAAGFDDTVRAWDLRLRLLTHKISLEYSREPDGRCKIWRALFSKDGVDLYASTSTGTVMMFSELMKNESK